MRTWKCRKWSVNTLFCNLRFQTFLVYHAPRPPQIKSRIRPCTFIVIASSWCCNLCMLLRQFPLDIPAILKCNNKVTSNTYITVEFWIQLIRSYQYFSFQTDPSRENSIWSYCFSRGLLMVFSSMLEKFNRAVLTQVARKIAPCNMAFILRSSVAECSEVLTCFLKNPGSSLQHNNNHQQDSLIQFHFIPFHILYLNTNFKSLKHINTCGVLFG